MNFRSKAVLRIWGALDAFHVLRYCLLSWQEGRVPYRDDWLRILSLTDELSISLTWVGWLGGSLQLSIPVSGILLLAGHRLARYLAFAQIPLRLLLLYPSISFLLLLAPSLPGALLLVLLCVSESLKGWSLWKYG